ncbi:MAG TPA: OmpA family protein [Xanthomonadaceae bacterium]|nr:OmpA family protein [Xanthomonadaceae bacterium]
MPGDIQKVVAPGGCQTTLVASADALFAFDRSDLGPGAQATLKQLAEGVAERTPRSMIVRGYTAGKGSDDYNRKLSGARADAVRDWLKPKVPVAISAEAQAHRKNDPVAPDTNADGSDNPDGRAKNRRVEIVPEYCHASWRKCGLVVDSTGRMMFAARSVHVIPGSATVAIGTRPHFTFATAVTVGSTYTVHSAATSRSRNRHGSLP